MIILVSLIPVLISAALGYWLNKDYEARVAPPVFWILGAMGMFASMALLDILY